MIANKNNDTPSAENLLLDPDADDQALLNEVLAFYQRRLRENEKAQAYLAKRRIHDAEAIERFKIGYADRQLGLSLPSKDSSQGKQLRRRLQELGIFRSTGHGHFNGCLVFPVSGADGRISEIYGRKIGQRLRAGTALHLYLREGEAGRGIWNAAALKETDEIILCHSILEALTFWCAGYRNATAAYGTGGFTEDHLTALTDNRPRPVLIAYGNRDAANAAAQAVAQRLHAAGIQNARIGYPQGQDANDLARHADDPREALEKQLHDAGQLQAKPKPTKDGPSDPAALGGMPAEPVIKQDIGKLLLELEQLQQDQIEAATRTNGPKVELSAQEKHMALQLLKDPNLVDRILADYDACGLVGEQTNKLVCN